ncbi:MAG: hypothetical protein WC794_03880 [Candidatus Doudnabacteria bacterium]|jgi:hypothetical protein
MRLGSLFGRPSKAENSDRLNAGPLPEKGDLSGLSLEELFKEFKFMSSARGDRSYNDPINEAKAKELVKRMSHFSREVRQTYYEKYTLDETDQATLERLIYNSEKALGNLPR